MNLVFVTLSRIRGIEARGIYTDLMREFRDQGHNVYIVTPYERRFGLQTSLKEVDGVHILGVKTLNIQKTNVVEKGIGTIMLERQLKRAVARYLSDVHFDLILYSTPPITFTGVIKYLKQQNPKAVSYLLLKDIFPQNAVDLEMFSKNSIFYKYFRAKEINLYKLSDYIGCMSPANVEFLLKYNPYVDKNRVEVAPNTISLVDNRPAVDKNAVRQKYGLPTDKPIFIYGGNLGKPQGVDYLLKCMEANMNREDCYFVIVGGGTEFGKIEAWYKEHHSANISLFSALPKEEYDKLVASCDVGLIFLDHRFLIPNFPSRLLSYLENKMPIIAATDVHCDMGYIAEQNHFGYWCESVNPEDFTVCINKFIENQADLSKMGDNGYDFLLANYQTCFTYNKICSHLNA